MVKQTTIEENRKGCGRRDSDTCMHHEARDVQSATNRRDIIENKICVNTIKKEMQTKVNLKLFYSTAGGVFICILIILGVQWGTYLLINTMALDHEKAMGKISTTISEVKLEVKHGNKQSETAREVIKQALDNTNQKTEKQIEDIKKQIEKLDKKPG